MIAWVKSGLKKTAEDFALTALLFLYLAVLAAHQKPRMRWYKTGKRRFA